jgi:hypothetical protein
MQVYNSAYISKTPGSMIQKEILNYLCIGCSKEFNKTFRRWVI